MELMAAIQALIPVGLLAVQEALRAEANHLTGEPYARGKKSDMLAGKILALLFFEPSTRTRMSFSISPSTCRVAESPRRRNSIRPQTDTRPI